MDTGTAVVNIYEATKAIVTDPALQDVVKEVIALQKLEKSTTGQKGIGLNLIVKPLRAYRYVRENPMVLLAVGLGILAVPFLLGYATGKKRR